MRARVRVDLHVPWGSYRVVVEELDIRYTLGEAARRREEIVRRLSSRGRDDDKEDTVRKRLEVYRAQTRPLVDYYGNWAATKDKRAPQYRRISGLGSIDEIKSKAFAALT